MRTGTGILTFNTPICPAKVEIYWLRLQVRAFNPKPMLCYKCQRFGHQTKYCRAKLETCVQCGAHDKLTNCLRPAKSSKCSGAHRALDKSCPICDHTKEQPYSSLFKNQQNQQNKKMKNKRSTSSGEKSFRTEDDHKKNMRQKNR